MPSISSVFFLSSRRRHTRYWREWSSDVCSSDLESVCLGRVEGCFQDAQTHRLQGRIELRGVNVIAVVDEEPVRFLSRDDLPELLQRPVRSGMSSDVEVSDSARSHFHDNEDVQHSKAVRHADEKIAGQYAMGVVADKCHPTLRRGPAWRSLGERHVASDGPR